jgi:Sap, sulfolipid-1-addressing protein
LGFVGLTVFLLAIPSLLVLLLGARAQTLLPKVRNWMTNNSWVISECVLGIFIVIETSDLIGS